MPASPRRRPTGLAAVRLALLPPLAPGSGDPLENDYLETAVWADLVREGTR